MRIHWKGVFPAITTQFRADQSLDPAATARHLNAMIQAGIHGVVFLGTVGENTALEYQEKLTLLKEMKQAVDGRIPVLTGVAEYTTPLACRFARDAEQIGVDGLMALPAMVYKSDRRETLAHFRAVARATSLPVMVYNNPVSYAVDVTPDMFEELADEPSIVAIKESSENVRRITDLVNQVRTTNLANAFPEENRALWDLAASGQWELARELYRWYTPLLHLDTKIKLVQYIKLAMAETGLGSEWVRAPRLPLAGAERDEILAVIRKAIAARPTLGAATEALR